MEDMQNVNVNETDTQEEVKTYTQDEVLALIQSEADKRVSSALKTQQAKFEKQLSLSQLDKESREKAMKEDRIAELEAQLAEFNKMQTKAEVTKVLSSRGLDVRFADLIEIGEDVEAAQSKIDVLDKLFKAAVKAEVEKRIGGAVPKQSTVQTQGLTKEQFKKMSCSEQQALFEQDRDLYMSLV